MEEWLFDNSLFNAVKELTDKNRVIDAIKLVRTQYPLVSIETARNYCKSIKAGRVLPQAATAQPAAEADAGEFLPPIKRHDDETWYEKGYNNGYEAAAKIAREQYALVNYWADKNAELMTDLAALRSQVAALTSERDAMRAALAEIYDDADYMLEDQYDDDERTHRYFKGIRDAAYVVLKKGSQS